MFLVRWDDRQGSKSWVPAEDVTDYAIKQYYKEKDAKKKKRRRRRQWVVNKTDPPKVVVKNMHSNSNIL